MDVVGRADGIVEVLRKERDAEREQEADESRKERVEQDARRGRLRPRKGRIHDRQEARAAVRRKAEQRRVGRAQGDQPALERGRQLLLAGVRDVSAVRPSDQRLSVLDLAPGSP